MSDSPLKSQQKLTAGRKAIDEICTFSSVKMFAHLFDVSPALTSTVTQIESQCRQILRSQLRSDLLSVNIEKEGGEDLIRQAALEESLSVIFSAHSDFWEQYYRRINRRTHSMESIPVSQDTTVFDFHNTARTRYPHFFITVDVMNSVDGKDSENYQLIQMSLQAFLKGFLLHAQGCSNDMREAMLQALKLIGPLYVPEFRKMLIYLVETQ